MNQALQNQLAQVNAHPVSRQQGNASAHRKTDPRFINPSKGLGFNCPYWLALPSWTLQEAILLLSRKPGVSALLRVRHRPLRATVEAHFRHDPAQMLDKFERAIAIGDITDPARPQSWIALARRLKIAIPRKMGTVKAAPGTARETQRIGDRKKGGRKQLPFWPQADAVAYSWLEENGCPSDGDGNQAALERHVADWLEAEKHDASVSTIRRHVQLMMKKYRQDIAGS